MPLSPPVEREHLHTRHVTCQGFRRADGLWDIEGRLVDTKSYGFANHDRGGRIEAGEPIHEMLLRVTVDDDLIIRHAEAVIEHAPYALCASIAPVFAGLAGVSIGPGFLRVLRGRFGGVRGCTHIVEMFGPIATAAFQTIVPLRRRETEAATRPSIIDTCHALAADGPVVAREWPQHHIGGKVAKPDPSAA
ncbi:MAG TPA: DUF2889 domain-containing protein [Patescibacteria group bacterium]|nr:DUF2889 domain-containing protein [Patescibacteria group bacterium]